MAHDGSKHLKTLVCGQGSQPGPGSSSRTIGCHPVRSEPPPHASSLTASRGRYFIENLDEILPRLAKTENDLGLNSKI
ncbi:hypothetical protein ACT691_06665 [Vibrio metschnikovii]